MQLAFTKMHGLGNDFVVIDAVSQPLTLQASQIRRLADRHRGIGCDQLLLVESPLSATADFRYRIFNADGEEVEQCGNGARCFARFVHDAGLTRRRELTVETVGGPLGLRLLDDGQVAVNMGRPRLLPAEIPFVADAQQAEYALRVDDQVYTVGAASMGNPHAVMVVEDVDQAPVADLGPRIENHERFPRRTNVGFVQYLDRTHIRLRVFERGVGETQACGSGACAAVVCGHVQGRLDETVKVDLLGGRLIISWRGPGHDLSMTGPAATVFKGTIEL